MRRPFIAGNWKMNLHRDEALALARDVAAGVMADSRVEVAVCPPLVYLDAVGGVLLGTSVGLGAQNVFGQRNGAFTGEVSPSMLVDLGCRYVIVGHSERRHGMGETNSQVNSKLRAALAHGLIPIVCVGELLAEREAGRTSDVIGEQFVGSFEGIDADQMATVVIAYEPVWAIGTGKVATPDQAQAVHADLRRVVETRYNTAVAESLRIQYGGSVKPENASELLAQPDIDGALVGGAALQADSFLGIVAAA